MCRIKYEWEGYALDAGTRATKALCIWGGRKALGQGPCASVAETIVATPNWYSRYVARSGSWSLPLAHGVAILSILNATHERGSYSKIQPNYCNDLLRLNDTYSDVIPTVSI